MAVRVFVSYGRGSAEHDARVLALADRLRKDGLDARIDQYVPHPPEGWPRWIEEQLDEADYVVLVCTPAHREGFDGKAGSGAGEQAAAWQGLITKLLVYEAGGNNGKVIPVLFEEGEARDVPRSLRSFTRHRLWDEYDHLYRHLTDQPETPPPPLGEPRTMPAAPRRWPWSRPPADVPVPVSKERRRSAENPTHTAIVLDRTDAWSALTNPDPPGHVAFIVYGTWQQDLVLFMERIATYFKDPAHCSILHHVVQVQPQHDLTQPSDCDDWVRATLAATRARRPPLAAALVDQATDRPVLMMLRSIDGPLQGLGVEERAALVSFLAESVGAALASVKLRHALRVVVPVEVAPTGKDPLVQELQRALNRRGSALKLRSPIALALPEWPEIEQHVVEEFARHELEPSDAALARCEALYTEVMARQPPPTLQELADPLHELVVELVREAAQQRR